MIKVIDILHQVEEKTQQYFEEKKQIAERLKIASKLSSLGKCQLDLRIHKKKK